MTPDQTRELLRLIDEFVDGRNRSRNFADAIEGALLSSALDETWFDDVSTALAQYVPGGGEHYFDEKALADELAPVAAILRSRLDADS